MALLLHGAAEGGGWGGGPHFTLTAAAIFLSLWETPEKEGRSAGSEDQQDSISDFHSGSHHVGIVGRRVLFTIPPENNADR